MSSSVQALCHCEAPQSGAVAISRKGYDVMIQGSLPRDSHVASLLRMTKKILAKTENLINLNYPKSQNFDEIVVFSAGFENSSVLRRTRIFKFRRKSRISQNYDF